MEGLYKTRAEKKMVLDNFKRKLEIIEANDLEGGSAKNDQERRETLQEEIQALKRKYAETTESLKKLQAEVKGLEEQRADLQRGGGIGNKEKIFAEKLKKISDELHLVEKRVKDLQARRDQDEIRAEQCKRDAEEIRAKVAAEEARL